MFNELKISSGINIFIGIFILLILVVSGYSLLTSTATSDNFDKIVYTIQKNDDLMTASTFILDSSSRIDSMMLNNLKGHVATVDEIASVRDHIGEARSVLNKFMTTPFGTADEKNIAQDVKKSFERAFTREIRKLAFINNPMGYPGDIVAEDQVEERDLRNAIDTYSVKSTNLSEQYASKAQNNANRLFTVACIALALSIFFFFMSRIWLKRAIFNRLEHARNAFKEIATGNLSKKLDVGSMNEIGFMLVDVEKMRQSLTETVNSIRDGVNNIYGSVHEIASSNNDLSSRTEEQASALQQTAASMEELKITVRQNADNAHSAKQLAESASISARNGGKVMNDLDTIMREITENSRQIADINSVIDSIANQTNILALNAAVEAARAGEQGRGFAVVAGEVRNLAKRSAEAAKEIRLLINTCVANMNTGNVEVCAAGDSMKEIVKSVIQVTDIMAEITSASDEQSIGISQIAQAVNEMDLVTQQNATMVEQAAKIASDVESNASDLEKMVSVFVVSETKNIAPRIHDKKVNDSFVPEPVHMVSNRQEEQWESF